MYIIHICVYILYYIKNEFKSHYYFLKLFDLNETI